jgi:hypothetical protein
MWFVAARGEAAKNVAVCAHATKIYEIITSAIAGSD